LVLRLRAPSSSDERGNGRRKNRTIEALRLIAAISNHVCRSPDGVDIDDCTARSRILGHETAPFGVENARTLT
jgi:hypothetical protein